MLDFIENAFGVGVFNARLQKNIRLFCKFRQFVFIEIGHGKNSLIKICESIKSEKKCDKQKIKCYDEKKAGAPPHAVHL